MRISAVPAVMPGGRNDMEAEEKIHDELVDQSRQKLCKADIETAYSWSFFVVCVQQRSCSENQRTDDGYHDFDLDFVFRTQRAKSNLSGMFR